MLLKVAYTLLWHQNCLAQHYHYDTIMTNCSDSPAFNGVEMQWVAGVGISHSELACAGERALNGRTRT